MRESDSHEYEEVTLSRRRFLQGSAGVALALSPALAGAERAAAAMARANATVKPVRGGVLRMVAGGEITDNHDMFGPTNSMGFMRRRQIFEPLVMLNPASRGYSYVLAKSITPYSADGSEWIIKLRDGIRWSDGTQFTADDVIYTIKTHLDPATASASAVYFSGADPNRIIKVDDLTLRVGLRAPVVDFLDTLAAAGVPFMVQKDSRRTSKEVIGTGPFQLNDFTAGQSGRLTRNKRYTRKWGGDGPFVDAIEMLNVNSEFARINALRAGQADWGSFISPASAKANEKSTRVKLAMSERGAPYVFNMNLRIKPFDDARVRLAFKLACDRKELVSNTMLGFGRTGNDMYGLDTPEYDESIPQRAYDPDRARQLLQQAGAANLETEIHVFNYGIQDLGMSSSTLYAEQLKKVGVNAKVVNLPYTPFRANLQSYLNTVPIFGYLASDSLPHTLWGFIYGANAPLNYTGWVRQDWDAKLAKARSTLNATERKKLYNELQKQLWDDSGEIVWGWASTIVGRSPHLKGVVDAPDRYTSGPLFKDAWLAKSKKV